MDAVWQWLERAGAQRDVVDWSRPYGADFTRMWSECPRGDWLLALGAQLHAQPQALVRAASDCARLALAHVRAHEPLLVQALVAAERWSRGELAADACAIERQTLVAALDQTVDAAAGAAIVACMSVLDAIADPQAAVNAAAFAAQASVLDAGDCAMMETLRFTQRKSAQLVRESLCADDMRALYLSGGHATSGPSS